MARAQWRTGNVWIQRIAARLINNIKPEDSTFQSHEFSVYELMGYQSGKALSLMRSILRELASQVVILSDPKTKDLTARHVFADGITYSEKNNSIVLCLNPALRPYYIALKRDFTTYKLDEFLSLPGTSFQSLYKFLKSWESEKSKTEDLKNIHRLVSAAPYLQEHYGRFDQKILKPAHKHINEHTSLKYDYEPQKFGRKVVSVIFTFHSKPKIRKIPPKGKNSY